MDINNNLWLIVVSMVLCLLRIPSEYEQWESNQVKNTVNKQDDNNQALSNKSLELKLDDIHDNDQYEHFQFDEALQNKIVFGYIRDCQQLLPKNKTYFNIPESLYSVCFIYYFTQFDEWNVDEKYHSKYLIWNSNC